MNLITVNINSERESLREIVMEIVNETEDIYYFERMYEACEQLYKKTTTYMSKDIVNKVQGNIIYGEYSITLKRDYKKLTVDDYMFIVKSIKNFILDELDKIKMVNDKALDFMDFEKKTMEYNLVEEVDLYELKKEGKDYITLKEID